MKESEIQKQILDYLKIKKIFHYRNNSGGFKRDNHFYQFGTPGSPDIIAIINGIYTGIEVKDAKGKQNDNQIKFQQDLERAGGKYYLVRTLEEVMNIIK